MLVFARRTLFSKHCGKTTSVRTLIMCSVVPLRRESERRNHSLARHADILAAVETRLSLLNMTFMKYVDSNLCCFIPGKVSALVHSVTFM